MAYSRTNGAKVSNIATEITDDVYIEPTYTGFVVDDLFVIGYGLDFDQKFRGLPYISYLEEDDVDNAQLNIYKQEDMVEVLKQEILEMVGVKYQTKTVHQYTTKLVMMGMLRPTTTASHDPNRKYITTHGEQED